MADVIDYAKERMNKTISVLNSELATLRAGRANPQLVERILVDYYGTQTPINQLGNLSTPEPRLLVISVWDNKAIPAIEKAIQKSDLGINPANDGKVIKLVFPPLTEERRKQLAKQCGKEGEQAKVSIRNARRDGIEQLKKAVKDGLSEDNQKDGEADLQKMHDKYIKQIESLLAAKEKEIMTV
jgi:ribosome recycling factor